MSDNSSEKNLPPSERKLRKAREEEGNIPHSRDLVQTASLCALLVYFMALGPSIIENISVIFQQISYLQGRPLTDDVLSRMLVGVLEISMSIAIVPLIISTMVSMIFSIIDAKGIVFSIKPVTPKLSHLDPIKGIGRLFGSQGLIYLAMNFLRATLIIVVSACVAYYFLRSILFSATCSLDCVVDVTLQSTLMLILICTGILVVSLIFEIPLSRAFFSKQMKMTHSELKREQKDVFGDPIVKTARQNIRNAEKGEYSGNQYIMLLYLGPEIAVGLHYVRGRTAAPVICSRAQGSDIEKVIQDTRDLGAIIIQNNHLASALFKDGRRGKYIPVNLFNNVAVDLIRYGLL